MPIFTYHLFDRGWSKEMRKAQGELETTDFGDVARAWARYAANPDLILDRVYMDGEPITLVALPRPRVDEAAVARYIIRVSGYDIAAEVNVAYRALRAAANQLDYGTDREETEALLAALEGNWTDVGRLLAALPTKRLAALTKACRGITSALAPELADRILKGEGL